RADHPRPQIRYASPSTATAIQGPTGKDRCLASPHNKLDPNRSLPKPTQKTALPTPFSEEPIVLAIDDLAARESAKRSRLAAHGPGDGRSLLRVLPKSSQTNHARHRRHVRRGAWRPAVAIVQRAL